jgi:hypothetical protein
MEGMEGGREEKKEGRKERKHTKDYIWLTNHQIFTVCTST